MRWLVEGTAGWDWEEAGVAGDHEA